MAITRRLAIARDIICIGALFYCCCFSLGAFAQGLPSSSGGSASATPMGQLVDAGGVQPCETCPPCCCPSCCRGHQGCLARHMSSIGGFNCACRGSYKFPVPPQYTYHWPGLYSQQAIVTYQSPYRYPLLKLPSWMEKRGNGGLPEGEAFVPLTPSPGEKPPQTEPTR